MCFEHHAVGPAVGLAGDDRDLGHRGLGEGVEQLGAVADDPAVLLGGAGEEAGHVLEGDEGDVEGVAEAHEAGALHARRRCRGTPASTAGWLATTPTGLPARRAKPTTRFGAKCSCTSKKRRRPPRDRMSSLDVVGLVGARRARGCRGPRRRGPMGSSVARRGGSSRLFWGR